MQTQVTTKVKTPFAWQHKCNLRAIRRLAHEGRITRKQAQNCLTTYLAITEFISDHNCGAILIEDNLIHRLAGYAMTSADVVRDALAIMNKHGIIRYEQTRNGGRFSHILIELINQEGRTQNGAPDRGDGAQTAQEPPEGPIKSAPSPFQDFPETVGSRTETAKKSSRVVDIPAEAEQISNPTVSGFYRNGILPFRGNPPYVEEHIKDVEEHIKDVEIYSSNSPSEFEPQKSCQQPSSSQSGKARKRSKPPAEYRRRIFEAWTDAHRSPTGENTLISSDYQKLSKVVDKLWENEVSLEEALGTLSALVELERAGEEWVQLKTPWTLLNCISRYRSGKLKLKREKSVMATLEMLGRMIREEQEQKTRKDESGRRS